MSRGYSLLELLVALGVGAVVCCMSLPVMSEWQRNANYRRGAREIVSALRLARSHAVTRTREVVVDFDLDVNRYRLRVGDLAYGSGQWDELTGWSPLPENVLLAATKGCTKRGDGDPSTSHIDSIQFNPNGTCGASGELSGYYICVLDDTFVPRFAGAILSTSTGRAVVRQWNATRHEWQ